MWTEVERPGYFGKKRIEIVNRLNSQYGENKWRELWVLDGRIINRSVAVRMYEDAYFIHLRQNPEILEKLLSTASDVYDNDPTNVGSGCDYSKQETIAVHLQDIAIRNAIRRLGKKFAGNKLLQVRTTSVDEIGRVLSPGIVPFHRSFLIRKPHLQGWWSEGSIEDFYQSNKIIAKWEKK